MGYPRGILNYPEKIILSNPTHMISMDDLVAINVKILMIDITCSLEKEFIEFININPRMVIIPNCQLSRFMS